jgi:hypothetical protein
MLLRELSSNKSHIVKRRNPGYLYRMKIFLTTVLLIAVAVTHSQEAKVTNDSLLGTWKGTSICQVKPSPCNDEIAVYHIAKGAKPNTYHIVASKVINEKEEEMGAFDYDFDASKQVLSYRDHQRNVVWTFKVGNHRMDGTLVYNDQVYRIIKLTKTD